MACMVMASSGRWVMLKLLPGDLRPFIFWLSFLGRNPFTAAKLRMAAHALSSLAERSFVRAHQSRPVR